MAELSGSLASVPLDALIGLLGQLGKSGDALVLLDEWTACLSFERGRLIGAAIERDTGRGALEFIGAGMRQADFQFWEGSPILEPNLPPGRLGKIALARAPDWACALPHPEDVPRRLPDPHDPDETRPLPLSRAELAILLEVDGRTSVRRIAWRHGLLRTMAALATLLEQELITYEPPAAEVAAPSLDVAPEAPALVTAPVAVPER